MESAIEVIRWVGLVLALGLTLTVLKEVFLVIRTLADIRALSERIRDASRGIAANVAPGERLSGLEEPVTRLREAGGGLTEVARRLGARVDDIAGGGTAGR